MLYEVITILAHQGVDLPREDLEADVVYGDGSGESLADLTHLKGQAKLILIRNNFV